MSCIGKECHISLTALIDIRLAGRLVRRMHIQHRDSAVDDFHSVIRGNVSDRSAAALVYFSELAGLESNAGVVHYTAHIGDILCRGIV